MYQPTNTNYQLTYTSKSATIMGAIDIDSSIHIERVCCLHDVKMTRHGLLLKRFDISLLS